ncbi:MAG: transposase family protein [bacterium]
MKTIIVMSIYAILSGNYDSENIEDWLNLENGIPSADTFLRVFRIV